MDQVTQQNAALVEEAAAASASMQEQAGMLASAVGVFRIDARDIDLQAAMPAAAAAPLPRPASPKAPAKAVVRQVAAPAKPARKEPSVAATAGDWEEF